LTRHSEPDDIDEVEAEETEKESSRVSSRASKANAGRRPQTKSKSKQISTTTEQNPAEDDGQELLNSEAGPSLPVNITTSPMKKVGKYVVFFFSSGLLKLTILDAQTYAHVTERK
jgi:hypothetical protein